MAALCGGDSCEKPSAQGGYCYMHYSRLRRHGDLGSRAPQRAPGRTCSEPECVRPHKGNGLCSLHYQRQRALTRPPARPCRDCGALLPRDASRGRRLCDECKSGLTRPPAPIVEFGKPCARCGFTIDMAAKGRAGRKRRSDVRICQWCRRSRYTRHGVSPTELAARDGFGCRLCGELVDFSFTHPHRLSASVDHVIPYAHGGSHDPANLQLAHLWCNSVKSNRPAFAMARG